jgi:hypothetical protein
MSEINLFEFATRKKLRFDSTRGTLTVEQLWDVPLRSNDEFNLDTIAKTVNRALKSVTEESFVATGKTSAQTQFERMLEVVKHIIGVKLEEEALAKKRVENRAEKEKLLQILAEKQAGKLSELSEKEIQKRIAALDD